MPGDQVPVSANFGGVHGETPGVERGDEDEAEDEVGQAAGGQSMCIGCCP